MAMIHINKLEPGMVLADEVRDLSGRLLLGKGNTVQPDHFRVFKIWGVTEINIRGNNGDKKEAKPNLDPEQLEKIKESTMQVFSHNDLNHPAIKEIFRLSVLFRNEYTFSNTNSNVQLVEDEPAKNIGEKNCKKKLADANIKLPEVPSIVFELNEVIANPMSSADDIAQVVQKSPSMTAILLKISSAVILIGTREIAGLALGLSVLSTFDKIPKGLLDMFSFLKHSVACGILTRMLASRKGTSQTEQFFVSGLLHDLGRLIIYCNFPEDSRNILNLSRTANNLLYEVERDYLGCNHSHVAKFLIKKWKLPISLENNIFYHHNPSEARQTVPATLVHLADIITNGLGIGTNALGLSPTCFEIVIKQATHQFFALESMLEN
jgi:HD-like signal output (HDOD) protein